MKIKVENKTITEVEITLPLFRSNGHSAFKVYSDQGCIWAAHGHRPLIQDAHVELAWNSESTKDCTEEEFMKVYNQTLSDINDLLTTKVQ